MAHPFGQLHSWATRKKKNGKSCVPKTHRNATVGFVSSWTVTPCPTSNYTGLWLVCMCLMTCIFWDSLSSLFVGTSEKATSAIRDFNTYPPDSIPLSVAINPFNKTYFISSWPVEGSISSNCLVVSSKLLGCCWWDPPRKNLSHLDLFLLRILLAIDFL